MTAGPDARAAAGMRKLPDQRLTQAERIRRRPEYVAIYESGLKLSGRLMTVFVRVTDQPTARLGIAATRKYGSAVQRNRAKRLVREVFRHNKLQAGLDVVVIPRREMREADYAHVEADYLAVLRRRGWKPRGA